MLRYHFLEPFRHKKLSQITTADITRVLDGVTPSTAAHAFAALRKFFNHAKGRRLILNSPCDGLQGYRANAARSRVLSPDEAAKVIRAAISGFQDRDMYSTIVLLLFLTMQRRQQIGHLKWSHLSETYDHPQGRIQRHLSALVWPAEDMKGNAQHFIPITETMTFILSKQPRVSEYVFPARGNPSKPYSGWSKSLKRFHDRSRTSGWTLHDLRRSASTYAGEIGVPPHVIDALTAHVGTINKVARIYNRYSYRTEMLQALYRVDETLNVHRRLLDTPTRFQQTDSA